MCTGETHTSTHTVPLSWPVFLRTGGVGWLYTRHTRFWYILLDPSWRAVCCVFAYVYVNTAFHCTCWRGYWLVRHKFIFYIYTGIKKIYFSSHIYTFLFSRQFCSTAVCINILSAYERKEYAHRLCEHLDVCMGSIYANTVWMYFRIRRDESFPNPHSRWPCLPTPTWIRIKNSK